MNEWMTKIYIARLKASKCMLNLHCTHTTWFHVGKLGTNVIFSNTRRDIGISYSRLILHETMLNNDWHLRNFYVWNVAKEAAKHCLNCYSTQLNKGGSQQEEITKSLIVSPIFKMTVKMLFECLYVLQCNIASGKWFHSSITLWGLYYYTT